MSNVIQKPSIQRKEAFGFEKNQVQGRQGKSTHHPTTGTTNPTTSFTCFK